MDKIAVPRFNKESGFTTSDERSKLMRKIRSTATKPEVAMRKALFATGFRYRLNVKKLPGKPDLVIHSINLAIFIDGEFWHGYNWHIKREKIKANRDFWIPKIERNMQRDLENNKALMSLGFTVVRFWEHEIKKDLEACISRIVEMANQT
jgi:DNA mismatch endonuclease (patch repair protein)